MTATRVNTLERGAPLTITVNGRPIEAYPGETIAAALMAAGVQHFRRTANGQPRGLFCGMGICFDCLVTVDGTPNVRSCVTRIYPGCAIEVAE